MLFFVSFVNCSRRFCSFDWWRGRVFDARWSFLCVAAEVCFERGEVIELMSGY